MGRLYLVHTDSKNQYHNRTFATQSDPCSYCTIASLQNKQFFGYACRWSWYDGFFGCFYTQANIVLCYFCGKVGVLFRVFSITETVLRNSFIRKRFPNLLPRFLHDFFLTQVSTISTLCVTTYFALTYNPLALRAVQEACRYVKTSLVDGKHGNALLSNCCKLTAHGRSASRLSLIYI